MWDLEDRLSHVGCVMSCGVGEVAECCVSNVPVFTSIIPDVISG